MDAALLLSEARERGVHVFTRDGRLKATPAALVSPALRAGLANNRAEIVALLDGRRGLCALSPNEERAVCARADAFTRHYDEAKAVRQRSVSGYPKARETDERVTAARRHLSLLR